MVIGDIPYDSPYTLKAEDRICIRLTSEDDDDDACKLVHDLILKLYPDFDRYFKFVSFMEDIEPLKHLCDEDSIRILKERKRNWFFSDLPELHGKITNDDNLYKLLTKWERTCYQTYLLYILEPTNVQDLEKVLEEDKYKETDSLDKVWSKVRLLIKNEWEAEYHYTFVLVLHKEDFEFVKGYIEHYTGSR